MRRWGGGMIFEKKTYNIRHIFGLEGHREPMSSYGCRSIVLGSDKQHGCPFRTHDKTGLVARLERAGLPRIDVDTLVQADTYNHCQIVCGRAFNIMQETPERTTCITSPADFYKQSVEVLEEKVVDSIDWDEPMVID